MILERLAGVLGIIVAFWQTSGALEVDERRDQALQFIESVVSDLAKTKVGDNQSREPAEKIVARPFEGAPNSVKIPLVQREKDKIIRGPNFASSPVGLRGTGNSPVYHHPAALRAGACSSQPYYQGCDSDSIEHSALYELKAMEHSWNLRDMGNLDYSNGNFVPVELAYKVEPLISEGKSRCLAYRIEEWLPLLRKREHTSRFEPGGTSFYASSYGPELRMCTVANYFNGTYDVHCVRPPPGTCTRIKVTRSFEHFLAFYNYDRGGGSISSVSGGPRNENEVDVFTTEHCESGTFDPRHLQVPTRGAGWTATDTLGLPTRLRELAQFEHARAILVTGEGHTEKLYDRSYMDRYGNSIGAWAMDQRANRGLDLEWDIQLSLRDFDWGDATGEGSVAPISNVTMLKGFHLSEWQSRYVWRDACGNLQRNSVERADHYRRCFERDGDSLIDFIGDSHLRYMSWCFSEEILHLDHHPVKGRRAPEGAEKTLIDLDRDDLFDSTPGDAFKPTGDFEPTNLASHAAAKKVLLTEVPPEFLPHATTWGKNTMRCFLDVDTFPPAARACNIWVATFGAAATALEALRLRFPRAQNPWTSSRVAVIMLGHWSSAGQRDPRAMLQVELPSFFDEVERLRADPQTTGMRIVLDIGPIAPGESTGWRNDHAMAAARAYAKRATELRPDLRIEWLSPSYFQATITRREDQEDGVHFLKFRENVGSRRPESEFRRDPITGDGRFCSGEVGEAFSRLLLDFLCPVPVHLHHHGHSNVGWASDTK